jgi:tight adherence protein B
LRADLQKADIQITLTEIVLIQLSVGLALALVFWLVAPMLHLVLAIVGFLLGPMLVRTYIRMMGKRRVNKFQEQLPDTLSVLSTSVRGGFSLFQALQLIAREAPQPAKNEFLRVVQEVSLGANMDSALEGLATRIPTEDVDILVTAINLQHQTGGNLSHMLDVVAHTLRERQRIQREIHSLTAQARFSAILLTALPYLMAAVLFIIAPTYIGRLFDIGWVLCMPIGAVIMSIIGFLTMRKMGTIDV